MRDGKESRYKQQFQADCVFMTESRRDSRKHKDNVNEHTSFRLSVLYCNYDEEEGGE